MILISDSIFFQKILNKSKWSWLRNLVNVMIILGSDDGSQIPSVPNVYFFSQINIGTLQTGF